MLNTVGVCASLHHRGVANTQIIQFKRINLTNGTLIIFFEKIKNLGDNGSVINPSGSFGDELHSHFREGSNLQPDEGKPHHKIITAVCSDSYSEDLGF